MLTSAPLVLAQAVTADERHWQTPTGPYGHTHAVLRLDGGCGTARRHELFFGLLQQLGHHLPLVARGRNHPKNPQAEQREERDSDNHKDPVRKVSSKPELVSVDRRRAQACNVKEPPEAEASERRELAEANVPLAKVEAVDAQVA
eukprot:CAMPEP_0171104876 /NCGR_PEP_ID=MMETSP0766_2-20121228/61493_1 /TAXON_ID=439317 /ORGANISM="Gambierdiscus australes, Strain CAWD 149" /LENGTH=144 /DNA_ID=CAMNT_0011565579 /DNA_START=195 /DNA_END=630 /DNA_ORIENTATION=-